MDKRTVTEKCRDSERPRGRGRIKDDGLLFPLDFGHLVESEMLFVKSEIENASVVHESLFLTNQQTRLLIETMHFTLIQKRRTRFGFSRSQITF